MNYPKTCVGLKRVHHPKRIPSVSQRQLQHAGTEANQRFGDRGVGTLRNCGECIKQVVARALWKVLKIAPRRFDQLDRSRVSYRQDIWWQICHRRSIAIIVKRAE